MIKYKLLTLLIFVLCSGSIVAQTGKITGFVTDSEGEPLPGVSIVIEGTVQGAASTADGYYQILNVDPGVYTLRASFIGFATVLIENVEVNTDLTTRQDFVMSEQTIEGEEIVVTAEQPVVRKDVSSSQANISTDDIKALPVTSVASVIGLQAGVEGLSIRGSGSDEVAFNLNGFNLRSGRDNSPFTGISVTSIQSVQVQTGGFNAEYGDLRSGLINVTSKEGSADRYTVDGIVRYTPPQAKNVGQRINDPNSYWLRPYMDDDVAWTGTNNGAWDQYTQDSYPQFQGWNAFSQSLLADDNPDNDLSPAAAQQAFLWQHRKDFAITNPDYEFDLTIGGPVPGISEKLGDLRFSSSIRQTQTMYIVPLSEDRYKQTTFQTKLTSNIADGMKLSVEGLYSLETGTGASQSGNPGFFVSPSGISGSMDQVSFIDTRLYASDYWAPSERVNANIGAEFTHSLSENTFYEVQINNYFSRNNTNPGAFRDTTAIYTVGGVGFDEAPYGFFEATSFGLASGMRMGIGMSTSRDSSQVSDLTVKASITSQVNRFNLVKAGFELVRTHSEVNYGRFDKNLQSSNVNNTWDNKPYRLAAFLQDKIEFDGMIANLGLRMDYVNPNVDWYDYEPYSTIFAPGFAPALDTVSTSRVKPQVFIQPRVGVSFPITDNSKLFFNYGHALQLPQPSTLYLTRIEPNTNTVTRLATPNSPLAKTVAYEIGFEQNILDNYLVRISGYYKDITNDPASQSYVSRAGFSYSTIQPFFYRDIRGFEFTLRKQRGKYFWGEVNYTYDVQKRGFFGTLVNYENPFQQREYDRTTNSNAITRPVPRPFARLQLFFRTPEDLGPELLGGHPFGGWQLVPIVSWKAGFFFTYTGGGDIPGVSDNLKYRDTWSTSLRFTKNFFLKDGSNISFFADISNVLNRRNFNIFNSGLIDGNDYLDYMRSLHLPEDKLDEIGVLNQSVPGSDKPGDYRPAGIEYVPIQASSDLSTITNPNGRALYFNTTEREYYQFVNGQFVEAESDFVDKVLDDKAYINMPDQQFFNFLDPRTIRFGIKFSF